MQDCVFMLSLDCGLEEYDGLHQKNQNSVSENFKLNWKQSNTF